MQHTQQESTQDLTRDLDGLLFVADGCNNNNRQQVEINMIYQGDTWLLQACTVKEARVWLADAHRLVAWLPPLPGDLLETCQNNLSGIYEKPAFQIPTW